MRIALNHTRIAFIALVVLLAAIASSGLGADVWASDHESGGSSGIAPLNDNFENAAPIDGLPFIGSVDTTLATTEPGEPLADCPIFPEGFETPVDVGAIVDVEATVWFSFTADTDTLIRADTAGSDYLTVVAVYRGTSLENLILDTCGFSALVFLEPDTQFAFEATAEETYYLQVGGVSAPFAAGAPLLAILPDGPTVNAEAQRLGIAGITSGNLVLNLSPHITPSCPSATFTVDDPLGDTFGLGVPQHDIASVAIGIDSEALCLTLNFDAPVGRLEDGEDVAAVVAIPIDIDADPATGLPVSLDATCPPSSSRVIVETLAGTFPGFGLLVPVLQDFELGFGTATYEETAIILVFSLDAVGGDDSLAFSMAVGSFLEATDCLPNDGSIRCEAGACSAILPPPPPANDDFENAEAVPGVPFSASETTIFATNEPTELAPCAGLGRTVWYSFTPSQDGFFAADTFGSTFDTALAVYTGDSLASITNIACNDDSDFAFQSRVSFEATAGETYYFQAGGFFGDSGNLVFNLVAVEPVADMTGVWNFSFVGSGTATCHDVVTQTGTDLLFESTCSATAPAPIDFTITLIGSVDPITGEFFVSGTGGPCDRSIRDGVISGGRLSGFWTCSGLSGDFTAERYVLIVGDAGCDSAVNAVDAALILQFNAGLLSSLICAASADVNEDGATNALDAALILQFSAGLLGSLPP